jgi:hypothetical protein
MGYVFKGTGQPAYICIRNMKKGPDINPALRINQERKV